MEIGDNIFPYGNEWLVGCTYDCSWGCILKTYIGAMVMLENHLHTVHNHQFS